MLGSKKRDYVREDRAVKKLMQEKFPITLWTCPKCNRKQYPKETQCPRCKTDKPKGGGEINGTSK